MKYSFINLEGITTTKHIAIVRILFRRNFRTNHYSIGAQFLSRSKVPSLSFYVHLLSKGIFFLDKQNEILEKINYGKKKRELKGL